MDEKVELNHFLDPGSVNEVSSLHIPHKISANRSRAVLAAFGTFLSQWFDDHRKKCGTLGMVPLKINTICTLYSGNLMGISPFKGLLKGLNSYGNS